MSELPNEKPLDQAMRIAHVLFPTKAPARSQRAKVLKNGTEWVYTDAARGKKWKVIVHLNKQGEDDWIVVSIGGRSYIPPVEVVREIREAFLGKEAEVYTTLPSFSVHPEFYSKQFTATHLFYCLNGSRLPDFYEKEAPIEAELKKVAEFKEAVNAAV